MVRERTVTERSEMVTPNELKLEIQAALVDLRACEAALRQGEANLAHDVIGKTIARLERLLHDDSESRDR